MDGNVVIKNASELVTCSGQTAKTGRAMSDLAVINGGAVSIENGVITRVGRTDEVIRGLDLSGFEVIDATGKAVLPGLIDCHTHFLFAGYRADEFAWRLSGLSYMEIMERGGGISRTVEATRLATEDELIAEGARRLDHMLSFGVTTCEGKSGYGLDHTTEIKQLQAMAALDKAHPIDILPTFLGAHAVPKEYMGDADAYIDYVASDVLSHVCALGLARFCDVFCEKGVFGIEQSRRLLKAARRQGLNIKIHADEITRLGGAELAAELGATSADHLLHASDEGVRAMARERVVAVLLPATAFSLKEPYARARFMIDEGCAVALATDLNPGSCFSENIPLVFSLAVLYMGMTIEEAVTAFTINGAAALGLASRVGSIDAGKQGDLVVLEFPSYGYIPYHVGVSLRGESDKEGTRRFRRIKRRSQGAAVLTDLTVKEYIDRLAGGEATPGGGSVSALAGALSAALSRMVCNLTIGRKGNDAALDERMAGIERKAAEWAGR